MSVFLPGVFVVVVGVVAGHWRWRIRPSAAYRVNAAIAVVAASVALLVVVSLAAGFAARFAPIERLLERCAVVPSHHQAHPVLGALALGALAAAGLRVWSLMRRRRRALAGTQGRRFALLGTDEPMAYAAPGDPGCVVVSKGLLAVLSPGERRAVFAHERAHLDQRHDRYLLAGELAAAVLPLLRPLAAQVRHATERCADEAAAETLGGDRELVADAIARAALATYGHHASLPAVGGGSVPARVAALIDPPVENRSAFALPVVVAMGVVAAGAGTVQVHHLAELLNHICGL